tara:strand:- start:195 stop:1361 length:1167 start_codon:yes stop_codon:yes gene_type:complete
MGLFTGTQQQYYSGNRKSFTGDGSTQYFTIANSAIAFPSSYNYQNVKVYFDGVLQLAIDANGVSNFTFNYDITNGWKVYFATAPTSGVAIDVDVDNNFGNYQFISLDNIINNFMISQVGEGKLISKVRRSDVVFHAHRALAELSFDAFKSTKSQEIEIPASLTMTLPHDYVNYVKLTWSGDNGIEQIIYPTSKTSNPFNIKQDTDGNYSFDIDDDTTLSIGDRDDTTELIPTGNSDTWDSYKPGTTTANSVDLDDEALDIDLYDHNKGQRYGIDPQHAQTNGSFFIDELKGLIHFSSNLSGKTIILKYISDSLGTDAEMQVHKLAEEAMYKSVAYAVLSTKANIPEYVVQRFKKERFAEVRKAKLRLSNIKLEEITQILRGKSKWIKH